MPFADRTKTEDEATAAFRRSGLIRMGDNARVKQCRRFEGIFVQKIGSDQLTLCLAESSVRGKGAFHLVRTRLEELQQVAVAAIEISRTSASWLAAVRGRALGPGQRYGSLASYP